MKVNCAVATLVLASAIPFSGVLAQDRLTSHTDPPTLAPTPDPAAPVTMNMIAGRVLKRKSGQYVLQESASKADYSLDNQKLAKHYAGKVVFITGTVNIPAKTVAIKKIEAAA